MMPRNATTGRYLASKPGSRFWSRVDASGDCWVWTGDVASTYGRFWDGARVVLAHRWAYEDLVGSIPPGMQLDHLCRVRLCVNPDHLEPVSPQENVRRGASPFSLNSRLVRCRRDHEFTGLWRGRRTCRECSRLRTAAHRARRAAA